MANRHPGNFDSILSSDIEETDYQTVFDVVATKWKKFPALVNYFTEPAGTAAQNTARIQAMLTRGGYIRFTLSDVYEIDASLTGTVAGTTFDLGNATIKAAATYVGTAELLTLGASGVNDGPYMVTGHGCIFDANSKCAGVKITGHGSDVRTIRGIAVTGVTTAAGAITVRATDYDTNRLSNVYVDHNILVANAEGIHLQGLDNYFCTHNIIDGVTAQDGIEPNNTTFGQITHNNIRDCAQACIDVFSNNSANAANEGNKDLIIAHNNLDSTISWAAQPDTSVGIQINSGSSETSNERISVIDNKINGTFHIGIQTAAVATHTDILIEDNYINIGEASATVVSLNCCIELRGSTTSTILGIRGNHCELNPAATGVANAYMIGTVGGVALDTTQPRVDITGNTFKGLPEATANGDVIRLGFYSNDWNISYNRFHGETGQTGSFINPKGLADTLIVVGNDFTLGGVITSKIFQNQTANPIKYARDNVGWKTETWGAGSTSTQQTVITHGIGTSSHAADDIRIPQFIDFYFNGNFVYSPYSTATGSTTFTMSFNAAPASSRDYRWRATFYPTINGSE